MKSILIFLVIIVLIITVGYYDEWKGNPEKKELEITLSSVPKNNPPAQKPAMRGSLGTRALLSSVQTGVDFLLDTHIDSGPKQGEVIENTNKVVFGWKTSSQNKEKPSGYETKVEGIDEKWVSTRSTKRTVTLPPGPKEYTFMVRAKTKDEVEPSPASTSFKINTSSYFGKVNISSITKPYSSKNYSKPSLITLSTKLGEGESINITGWKIESKKGTITIPFGIEKYEHLSGSPANENIFVKKGDRIYISSAQNPLGKGKNFRPNKCFGWLKNYYDFPISVSTSCPKPKKEDYEHLDVCCRELINRTYGCKKPDYSKTIKTAVDEECSSYIFENFNYSSCFNQHFRDDDFLKNQWHIYLNRNIIAVNECDTLVLRDQNGLIVDTYDYGKDMCR